MSACRSVLEVTTTSQQPCLDDTVVIKDTANNTVSLRVCASKYRFLIGATANAAEEKGRHARKSKKLLKQIDDSFFYELLTDVYDEMFARSRTETQDMQHNSAAEQRGRQLSKMSVLELGKLARLVVQECERRWPQIHDLEEIPEPELSQSTETGTSISSGSPHFEEASDVTDTTAVTMPSSQHRSGCEA